MKELTCVKRNHAEPWQFFSDDPEVSHGHL